MWRRSLHGETLRESTRLPELGEAASDLAMSREDEPAERLAAKGEGMRRSACFKNVEFGTRP
jgi:hypothetical protein